MIQPPITSSKIISEKNTNSLQALRAIALVGVFLAHAQAKHSWAVLSVSIFFVLSGFLLFIRYENKVFTCSLKNNIEFSINKIKKLYPLHIITMVFGVILRLYNVYLEGLSLKSVAAVIRDLFLNITLLQTWYPKSEVNVSLNGVSWFLSVMMFLFRTDFRVS